MRFMPWKCPECGLPAKGTVETVPGLALLMFYEDGNADYSGETEIAWNQQRTEHNASGHDLLECREGHRWSAIRSD